MRQRYTKESSGGGDGGISSALFGILRLVTNAWLRLVVLVLLLAFSWLHHGEISAAQARFILSSTSSHMSSSSTFTLVTENSSSDHEGLTQTPPLSSSSLRKGKPDQRTTKLNNDFKIPHRFIFTYHSNILETKSPQMYYQNIMNTIQMYQQAWKQEELDEGGSKNDVQTAGTETPDVWFLTDSDCLEVIDRVEPALRRHFENEQRGDFKGDICLVAALYDRGGYYFDVDMLAIKAVPVAPHVRFTSAVYNGDYFFQSFLASEARSPIIGKTIQVIRLFYDEQAALRADFCGETALPLQQAIAKHEQRLGFNLTAATEAKRKSVSVPNLTSLDIFERMPVPDLTSFDIFELFRQRLIQVHVGETDLVGVGTLRTAYRQVMLQDGVVDEKDTLLLEESHLELEMYPSLRRQAANMGPFCNYIVHHPKQQQVYFFSRFEGTPKCRDETSAPKVYDPKDALRVRHQENDP